jgi:hypothetical protein
VIRFPCLEISRNSFAKSGRGTGELLRKGLVDLIAGRAQLAMKVTKFPVDPEFAKRVGEVQKLLIEWLEGKRNPPMAIQREF